jgi:hypothetical protein
VQKILNQGWPKACTSSKSSGMLFSRASLSPADRKGQQRRDYTDRRDARGYDMSRLIYLREANEYVGPFATRADAGRFLVAMESFGESVEGIEIVEFDKAANPVLQVVSVEERRRLLSKVKRSLVNNRPGRDPEDRPGDRILPHATKERRPN